MTDEAVGVLVDLCARMGRSQRVLLKSADDARNAATPARAKHLLSKAEGVGVAKSYVEEELRLRGKRVPD